MTWYGTMVVQGDGMQGNGMQWYGMCSTIRRIYACLSVYSHACMCMHAPACTHNALRSAGMLCTANANNKRYRNIIKIMIMIMIIVIVITHTRIYIICKYKQYRDMIGSYQMSFCSTPMFSANLWFTQRNMTP